MLMTADDAVRLRTSAQALEHLRGLARPLAKGRLASQETHPGGCAEAHCEEENG